MKQKKIKYLLGRSKVFWEHWLGLEYWTVNAYLKPGKPRGRNGEHLFGLCHVSWEYMEAALELFPENMKHLNEDQLERGVLHELVHILINEMRSKKGKRMKHEERVVAGLVTAFMWTKIAYRNEGQEYANRNQKSE